MINFRKSEISYSYGYSEWISEPVNQEIADIIKKKIRLHFSRHMYGDRPSPDHFHFRQVWFVADTSAEDAEFIFLTSCGVFDPCP